MKKYLALLLALTLTLALFVLPGTAGAWTVCDHSDGEVYVSNGDNHHYVLCKTCGAYLGVDTCLFIRNENGSGICVDCGQFLACVHWDENYDHYECYYSNGNGTHTRYCADCGFVYYRDTCKYDDDNKCTYCGYTLPEKACDHSSFVYKDRGNGTHAAICDNCKATIYVEECDFRSGVCLYCKAKEAVCTHQNKQYSYFCNNDGTHRVVCSKCHETIYAAENCNLKDSVCTLCVKGTDYVDNLDCSHDLSEYVFKSIGNGMHIKACNICGCLYHGYIGECHSATGTGTCEDCGYALTEGPCHYGVHNYSDTPVSNGNGTHAKVCTWCGDKQNMTTCHKGSDGKCTVCGGVVECEHEMDDFTGYGYSSNGDGTHNTSYQCNKCKEAVLWGTKTCTDNNDDGRCDYCDGKMPADCTHPAKSLYYQGQNNGWHWVICCDCGCLVKLERCTLKNGHCTYCDASRDDATFLPPASGDRDYSEIEEPGESFEMDGAPEPPAMTDEPVVPAEDGAYATF